tara:strand:- start:869 stop:1558 length:690 start_codon:yes stop_codon:yes gene_type:complete
MNNIKIKEGNIFNTTSDVLVNTVNCDGFMGKGMAFECKLRYPEMYIDYQNKCNAKIIKPGVLTLWGKSNPKILNFPTKDHWKFPSKIEYLELGLQNLEDICNKNKIESIAFPLLGTNQGGLDEDIVQELMFFYISKLDLPSVEIYKFNPNATDNLFEILKSKISKSDHVWLKNEINIPEKKLSILINKINNNSFNNMLDIQTQDGFGEKTLIKIYEFAQSENIVQKKLI